MDGTQQKLSILQEREIRVLLGEFLKMTEHSLIAERGKTAHLQTGL